METEDNSLRNSLVHNFDVDSNDYVKCSKLKCCGFLLSYLLTIGVSVLSTLVLQNTLCNHVSKLCPLDCDGSL